VLGSRPVGSAGGLVAPSWRRAATTAGGGPASCALKYHPSTSDVGCGCDTQAGDHVAGGRRKLLILSRMPDTPPYLRRRIVRRRAPRDAERHRKPRVSRERARILLFFCIFWQLVQLTWRRMRKRSAYTCSGSCTTTTSTSQAHLRDPH
jgi:hypothetical protein